MKINGGVRPATPEQVQPYLSRPVSPEKIRPYVKDAPARALLEQAIAAQIPDGEP